MRTLKRKQRLSEFDIVVKDFCEKENIKIDINYQCHRKRLGDIPTAVFVVEIKTPKGSYEFEFSDSVINSYVVLDTRTNKATNKYNIKNEFYNESAINGCSDMHGLYKILRVIPNPTEYDILSCLTYYCPNDFEEFCMEYGYNSDSIKDLETYRRVLNENKNIKRIFTKEQIEKLQEIAV